jgi:hypothetical protein
MKLSEKISYKIQNGLAYIMISFFYFLSLIYGIDNLKRLGRKLEALTENGNETKRNI